MPSPKISVIVPIFNEKDPIEPALNRLLALPESAELIAAHPGSNRHFSPNIARRVTQLAQPGAMPVALLNAGAQVAHGDIFLFLWPYARLPSDSLAAVARNFALLPGTVGGNFHLDFEQESLFGRFLRRQLKAHRYKGRYTGCAGGLFVTRQAFDSLNGFQPTRCALPDYPFIRRLEAHGPTLFLPQTVTLPNYRCGRGKLAALAWWSTVLVRLCMG